MSFLFFTISFFLFGVTLILCLQASETPVGTVVWDHGILKQMEGSVVCG